MEQTSESSVWGKREKKTANFRDSKKKHSNDPGDIWQRCQQPDERWRIIIRPSLGRTLPFKDVYGLARAL